MGKPTAQPEDVGTEAEIKLPLKVRRDLEAAIILRAKAKGMESEAKGMTASAKETILPIMAAYGIKSYAMEGIGTAIVKVNAGSAINAAKLTENLLLHGMTLKDIGKIVAKSSTTWSTEYVEFKGSK